MLDLATPQIRWRSLFIAETVVTLASAVTLLVWLPAYLLENTTAVLIAYALTMLITPVFTAWGWHVALKLLSDDLPVRDALRQGMRGIGRLTLWLIALGLFALPSLLLYIDLDWMRAYLRSPASTVLTALSWYASFATALLPMAILLERQGIRRAWLLVHTRLSTAALIAGLLLLDYGIDWLIDEFAPRRAESVIVMVISVPLGVLFSVAYYLVYRARVSPRTSDT